MLHFQLCLIVFVLDMVHMILIKFQSYSPHILASHFDEEIFACVGYDGYNECVVEYVGYDGCIVGCDRCVVEYDGYVGGYDVVIFTSVQYDCDDVVDEYIIISLLFIFLLLL
eukprot:435387_1